MPAPPSPPEGFDELSNSVAAALAEHRRDIAARLLIDGARRMLGSGWEPTRWEDLAKLLQANQQFGYARRLYRGAYEAPDAPADLKARIRTAYSLTIYKDLELPVSRRYARALEVLGEGGDMPGWSGEALGQAGAIYKRQWQADAKLADLENALTCYRMGYARAGDERQLYCGINAAFILDQLATVDQTERIAAAPQAKEFSRQARELRTEIAAALKGRTTLDKWDWATLAEAHFGLGDFDAAKAALQSYVDAGPQGWERESTASQFAELGRLLAFGLDPDDPRGHAQQFAHSSAADALRPLVPEGAEALLRRAYVGKVGLALSGGGFRASLYHIGVLARARRAQRAAPRRGALVRVRRLDRRRLLLPARAPLELQDRADEAITDGDYVELVEGVARDFFAACSTNLRVQDRRATWPTRGRWSRVELLAHRPARRALRGALLPSATAIAEQPATGWRMTDLFVTPQGRRGRLLAPLTRTGCARPRCRCSCSTRRRSTRATAGSSRRRGWASRPTVADEQRRRRSAAAAHVLRRRAAGHASGAAARDGGRRVGLRPGLFPPIAPRGRSIRDRESSSWSTAASTTTRAWPA